MVDLTVLAKYPFLNASKNYVRDNALSVGEIIDDPLYERARLIGIQRLDGAFKNRDVGNRKLVTETDCIMELISYPIARMISVCVSDVYFTRRYALAEAIHAYKQMINETPEFLLRLSEEFKFDIDFEDEKQKFGIYFTNYLHHAPTRYKEWKMINRVLKEGYISISQKDLARLIQEALRERINNELDARICDNRIARIFYSDINRFKNIVSKHRKKVEAAPMGKVDIEKLPPCMKTILRAIQSGENVPHMGRFALVAFLNSLRLSTNDILKLFSSAPDFEEEKTRYQIEHITGSTSATSYSAPGCEKMRTYGICPVDQMDDICKRKHHPLSYYKAKWKQKNKSN